MLSAYAELAERSGDYETARKFAQAAADLGHDAAFEALASLATREGDFAAARDAYSVALAPLGVDQESVHVIVDGLADVSGRPAALLILDELSAGIVDGAEAGIETERGRIRVNDRLNVPNYDWLWAVGDCSIVPLGDGVCPATAQFASRQGAVCGRNIARQLANKPLRPFAFTGLGELASIGHRKAVAKVCGVRFKGFFAWWLWRTVYLMKLPGGDRKLRVMLDWTLDLFFPRDINLLNPRYTQLLQGFYLDTGDFLFNKGEPADALYLLRSGRIRLVDEGRVVRVIQPGSYFGERALLHMERRLYDAEAAEPTEIVAVKKEVALPLIQESSILRRVFRRTSQELKPEDELSALSRYVDADLLEKPVADIMDRNLVVFNLEHTVEDALKIARKASAESFALVSSEGLFEGVLRREDLLDWIKARNHGKTDRLDEVETLLQPTVDHGAIVSEALERMVQEGSYVCWVTDRSQRLLGCIAMEDLVLEGE